MTFWSGGAAAGLYLGTGLILAFLVYTYYPGALGLRVPEGLSRDSGVRRLGRQSARIICGTSRLENQNDKRRAAVAWAAQCKTGRCQSPKKMVWMTALLMIDKP